MWKLRFVCSSGWLASRVRVWLPPDQRSLTVASGVYPVYALWEAGDGRLRVLSGITQEDVVRRVSWTMHLFVEVHTHPSSTSSHAYIVHPANSHTAGWFPRASCVDLSETGTEQINEYVISRMGFSLCVWWQTLGRKWISEVCLRRAGEFTCVHTQACACVRGVLFYFAICVVTAPL